MLLNKTKKLIYVFFLLLLIVNLSSCSDGKRLQGFLVFGSNRNDQLDAFILENGKVTLLNGKGYYPSISPDGKLIVCQRGGGKEQKEFGFTILDKKGKIKEFVKTKNPTGKLQWKGNRIYYTMSSSANIVSTLTPNVLFYYDVKKENHEKVVELEENDWISYYDVFGAGGKIIYTISDPKTIKYESMYLYDIGHNKTVELERNLQATWYPDGKHILCIMHPEKDKHELGTYWGHFTKYNLETGKKEYLARVPFLGLSGLKISQDGKYVYYAGPNSIYMSTIDDLSKREKITEPVRTRSGLSQDRSPDWYQGK